MVDVHRFLSSRARTVLPAFWFATCLALVSGDRLLAQASVPDSAASRYVGQTVTIEGLVANVHTSRAGKTTFLNATP